MVGNYKAENEKLKTIWDRINGFRRDEYGYNRQRAGYLMRNNMANENLSFL